MARDASEYNVRAIERALQILECFDDAHPARGVSEIAEAVGLHKATAHRIITTLVNHGYLDRLPGGQDYRLGMQLATLGLSIVRRMDLRREAMPLISDVVQQYDETCDLSIPDRGEALIVEVIRSQHVLSMATAVGQRIPLHATAGGKVLLAFMPEDEQAAILSGPLTRYTEATITSAEELRGQTELIRQRGYGFDDSEYEAGVRAVAAPVRDSGHQVVAVVSMPGPATRITQERIPEIAGAMIQLGNAISTRLGWRP